MKKKIFLFLRGTLFLFALNPAHAQQTGKVPRVGFLDTSTAAGSAVLLEAFRQELSKLGWIEGKNITIEYRFAGQKLSVCKNSLRSRSSKGRSYSGFRNAVGHGG
jgi:putative tryptophan/tyrosine transport system substrate-binding protein